VNIYYISVFVFFPINRSCREHAVSTTKMVVFFLLLEQHVDQVNQPKHDYSDHVRQQVYQALLMRSKNGKLGKQDTTIVGAQFGVKIRSVQRIWK